MLETGGICSFQGSTGFALERAAPAALPCPIPPACSLLPSSLNTPSASKWFLRGSS